MKWKNALLFFAIVLAGGSGGFMAVAAAAEIPENYRGTWSPEWRAGAWARDACDLEWAKRESAEFPFLLVTGDGIASHERWCRLKSISMSSSEDKLVFLCMGEGEEWTDSETWSSSQNLLIVDELPYRKCNFSCAETVVDTCGD